MLQESEVAPFNVNEEDQVEDLTDVKEDRGVVPASSQVMLKLNKVSKRVLAKRAKEDVSPDNPAVAKFVSLEVRIVEGFLVQGEMKYRNKPLFQDVQYWANAEEKTSDWYKRKQHLVQFKHFLVALGYDPSNPPAVGDKFLTEILERLVLGDIKQRPIQSRKTNEDGSPALDDKGKQIWINTGDLKNEVVNWKEYKVG